MEQSFDNLNGKIGEMDQAYVRFKEHTEHISSLIRNGNAVGKEQMLSDIYFYVKGITSEYYDGQKMISDYGFIRMFIRDAEDSILTKILNVPVEFDIKDTKEKDNFIEDLVHKTREYLVLKCWWYNGRVPFEKMNFAEECKNATYYAKDICNKKGITSYVLEIAPGFDSNSRLYGYDGLGFHYALVVYFENKYYLIDMTYSQFFYTKHNLLDRIGLVFIPPCDPGRFMMTDRGIEIATKIIRDGYIELNEDIFKTYMDAFTISFRNGLYYENTNDFSFKSSYSVDDYIKFLHGENSQLNIEGEENLGYQRRPLKNPMMLIKKND